MLRLIKAGALALTLAASGLGMSLTPVAAMPYHPPLLVVSMHHHPHPHRVRVCHFIWHHHHRVPVCHWAWRRW